MLITYIFLLGWAISAVISIIVVHSMLPPTEDLWDYIIVVLISAMMAILGVLWPLWVVLVTLAYLLREAVRAYRRSNPRS